ncbi:HlyD family efflux transporter periplasmic adaptor subunit [Amphibiibacter pelophylacis]|uniref:HlyD family efflux transporter periplasmic adaptor subunit n=1 Tax=Amphibiibacter pelophylacis TaxID=1799477 RepID=A0ACC6P2E2_9BURK
MSTTSSPDTPVSDKPRQRKLWLRGVGAVVVLGAIAAAAWYLLDGRWYESTDDAYVAGHIVPVSAQTPGTLVRVLVNNGDPVKAGQVLAEMDDSKAQLALASARAALVTSLRQLSGLHTQVSGAQAQLNAAVAAEKLAVQEVQRRERLAPSGAVSAEELSQARNALTRARAALASAREQFQGRQVLLGDAAVDSNPEVEVAAARLRAAWLDLQRTHIVAPVDGFVGKRNAELGQNVQAGQALMAVVPLQAVWVDANFKETQLRDLRLGQPVTLHADLYGSDVTYSARITSLGLGTGSAFSLLPAQNATGNWIKIVQRVPVQVDFTDVKQLQTHPLRVGMSMSVDVDIHDRKGPVLAAVPDQRGTQATSVYTDQLNQADAVVREVITANLPSHS